MSVTKEQVNGDVGEIIATIKKSRAKSAEKPEKGAEIRITPARFEIIRLRLVGNAPLVQLAFSEKQRNVMMTTQEEGSQSRKGKKREPKDFKANYENARHISTQGWDGIHAGGFKRALVDACTLCGFHMTLAKKAIFVISDGFEAEGSPLVKITKGKPTMRIHPVRNANGSADLRARPMWEQGWECILTVRYDADILSATDVVNLAARVGVQCGIGEGRPNSKKSCGMGWGTFDVLTAPQ